MGDANSCQITINRNGEILSCTKCGYTVETQLSPDQILARMEINEDYEPTREANSFYKLEKARIRHNFLEHECLEK